MHDLDESGEVAHYDVLFEHGVEKNVDVSSLEILEYSMHEHAIVDGYAVVEAKMEEGIEDIIARLEKKRISKGGDPDKSPLGKKTGQAMKAKQDAARKKAGVKEEVDPMVQSAVDALNRYSAKKQ